MVDTASNAFAIVRRNSDNPYRGAHWLDENDHLFGRDDELSELVSLLFSQRIAVLISASGIGKTSLLQAGLRNELKRREKLEDQPAFVACWLEGFRSHTGADVALGRNRYEAALLAALGVDDRSETLGSALDRLGEGRRILLVLDQFEELFTLDSTDWPAKRAFLAQLGSALKAHNRWALIAMRQEFIVDLEAYSKFFPGNLRARIHLQPFSRRQAQEAMIGPAREVAQVQFDELLAEDLSYILSMIPVDIEGARQFRQGDTAQPIHVQLVCDQLWKKWRKAHPKADQLTADDVAELEFVREAADLDKVLVRYYDEEIAETILEHPDLSERVLRDWLEQDLISHHQRDRALPPSEPGADAAVRHLEDRYLVTRTKANHAFFELSHDLLVPAVMKANKQRFKPFKSLYWKSARWVDNRFQEEDLETENRVLTQLEETARDHESLISCDERTFLEKSRFETDRLADEARTRGTSRIKRSLGLVVVVFVLVVAIVVGLRSAEDQRLRAIEERASAATLEAEGDPGLALAMAAEAAAMLEDGDLMPASLFTVLYRLLSGIPSVRVLGAEGRPRLATAMATSPANALLAVGDIFGEVVVYNAETEVASAHLLELDAPVVQIVAAEDGSLIGALARDGEAVFWQEDSGSWAVLDSASSIAFIAIRPDPSRPVMLGSDGITIREAGNEVTLKTPPAVMLAVSSQQTAVVPAATADQPLLLLVDEAGNQLTEIRVDDDGTADSADLSGADATVAAWSPSGTTVAVGLRDGTLALANPDAGWILAEAGEQPAAVRSVLFLSEDRIVTGSRTGLTLWSATVGGATELTDFSVAPTDTPPALQRTRTISHAAGSGVAGTGLSSSVNELVVLTTFGTVEWWRHTEGHGAAIETMATLPGFVVTGAADGSLRRWDRASLESVEFRSRDEVPVVMVASERRVFIVWADGVVDEYHEQDGELETGTGCTLGIASTVSDIAIHGSVVAILTVAGEVELRGEGICSPGRPVDFEHPVRAVDFAGDGSQLVAGLEDGSVVYHDLNLESRRKTTPGVGVITALATDREGPLYVGHEEGALITEEVDRLSGSQAGPVTDIAVDASSEVVVTLAKGRGVAVVWSSDLGNARAHVSVQSAVTAVNVRDGEIVVGDATGLVTLLPSDGGELETIAVAVSSWFPSTLEVCQGREWFDPCRNVGQEDLDVFRTTKGVIAARSLGRVSELSEG